MVKIEDYMEKTFFILNVRPRPQDSGALVIFLAKNAHWLLHYAFASKLKDSAELIL